MEMVHPRFGVSVMGQLSSKIPPSAANVPGVRSVGHETLRFSSPCISDSSSAVRGYVPVKSMLCYANNITSETGV
jgi:hypothetical protein